MECLCLIEKWTFFANNVNNINFIIIKRCYQPAMQQNV